MGTPSFIHLRLHTEYSIHDGLITLPALIEKTVHANMPAIAITDLGNLYGIVKFYQAAIAAGIKPIIGVDAAIQTHTQTAATACTLLCQNQTGYQHLLQLISLSYLEGQQQDGKPVIQLDWMRQHQSGLILLSGAEEGDIGQAILDNQLTLAQERALFWQTLFPDRFYIEIRRVGKKTESLYLPAVLQIAQSCSLPIVATNDIRFLERQDFEAHEARVCIQESVTLNDPRRTRRYTEQQYFRSTQEMTALFADLPEALQNTVEIAKRCNVHLTLGHNQLPNFTTPSHETAERYLTTLAKAGLEKRLHQLFDSQHATFAHTRQAYDKRLTRELDVINKMGFAGYFLIVADFTQWAKTNHIPVGPGRGSGSGSLVAYALTITNLDPIALDLLFERFLNPERISLPDFDIDFCIEGRDRVIDYVMQKYGKDCVAQIMTYGTMAAKAVVRDVGRVLGFPYGFVDKIAKLIPFELGITLAQALVQEPLLQERYDKEEEVRTLIDLARKLEGMVRNVGKHAGGIVIAPGPLTHFLPLYSESRTALHPVTQFDKDDVEAVGLIKFDFLGLKTLTIMHQAVLTINQLNEQQHKPLIDINHISLRDTKTFELLKACRSVAVFQLESHGMQELMKRLEPDCFEDLIALVALFRPGPLQSGMVDDFINRKHGRATVVYPHPQVEPLLRPTYGVILYQEQVMQIARVLAGYTLGAADILRRAMGKKKPEEMASQREIFCQGALQKGVSPTLANHIFDLIEKFSGYGFNKSHAAAYALIAYQTAWLKAHYPANFMAAVLSADMDKTEKVIHYLQECHALTLTILPPDINQSTYRFLVIDSQTLRYGLGALKGVGQATIDNIVLVREQGGPFKDLFDFCLRVDLHKLNRRSLEVLIKAGCFDRLTAHRAQLKHSLNEALSYAEQMRLNRLTGQQDLLIQADIAPTPLATIPPWPEAMRLQGEKEALGFYLTGHPITEYLPELMHLTAGRLNALHPTTARQTVRVAGFITNMHIKQTKRGDRIGLFSLEDGSAQIEVVCFSKVFNTYRALLNEDQLIIIEGTLTVDTFNQRPRLTAQTLASLEETRIRLAQYLKLDLTETTTATLATLESLFTPYLGGQCAIQFTLLKEEHVIHIKPSHKWLVYPKNALLAALTPLFNTTVMY